MKLYFLGNYNKKETMGGNSGQKHIYLINGAEPDRYSNLTQIKH